MDEEKYNIQVSVTTRFLDDRSSPADQKFVFAYTITISNRGTLGAQLMTRHWIVKDSDEQEQHVHGEGVVGEQPYLNPGEWYRYTSGTILENPIGTMEGSYQMVADDGTIFDAPIPLFVLSANTSLH